MPDQSALSLQELASREGRPVPPSSCVVCVQGLGFVGFAMAVAVASACDGDGRPYFTVIGVDLPVEEGVKKVQAINSGTIPVLSKDRELAAAFERVFRAGNL